jgi:hypothetical protein
VKRPVLTRAEVRRRLEAEIGKGSRLALLEWWFLAELEQREEARATGWDYGPVDDQDITKHRCRCCGHLRREVEVEVEFDGDRRVITECPDPCLGMLPGVMFACCGHGRTGRAYVVGTMSAAYGPAAAGLMRSLGGNPPPAAFQLDPVLGVGSLRKAGES